VLEILEKVVPEKLFCMAINKGGSPKHALYISEKTGLVEWI
jgi:hypothetical protein